VRESEKRSPGAGVNGILEFPDMGSRLETAARVHVLTEGYLTANSQGFLHPLLTNYDLFREKQVSLRFFGKIKDEIYDCDYLLIDSKFFRYWWHKKTSHTLDVLSNFDRNGAVVVWFHTGDSAGTLGAYSKSVLPIVKGFFKSQVYADKTLYQKSLYGNRLYTDFYHNSCGVEDSDPPHFDPVVSDEDLDKIKVSWNIGYARCFDFFGEYLASAYKRIPVSALLKIKPRIHPAHAPRTRGVYSRMGLNFPRKTVGFQREKLAQLVGKQPRVSRRVYYKEMKESKAVVSPFGWGEINNRDFEAFIYGCLLVKPSVRHLETFPNLFVDGQTYMAYQWDMSDMSSVLWEAEENYSRHRDLAIHGQERYIESTISRGGREQFVEHFCDLIGSV
jgi:hypothetical protein